MMIPEYDPSAILAAVGAFVRREIKAVKSARGNERVDDRMAMILAAAALRARGDFELAEIIESVYEARP